MLFLRDSPNGMFWVGFVPLTFCLLVAQPLGSLERCSLEAGAEERSHANRLLPPRAVDDDGVEGAETLSLQQGDESLGAENCGETPSPRRPSRKIHLESSVTALSPILFCPYLIPVAVGGDGEAQVGGHGSGVHCHPFLRWDAEVLGHVPRRGRGGRGRQPQEAPHAQAISENLWKEPKPT